MSSKSLAAALVACFLIAASHSQARERELPRCVNSGGSIAMIEGVQKANRKTKAKYDGYRKMLQDDSPLELATRLAYAETLAANCPAHNAEVSELITRVIGNRIRIRSGDVKSVVYQRDQFSSSLNIYPESRYRDFLCPQDEKLWRSVRTKMRDQLEATAPSTSIPGDAVNYYLYRHSERLKAPDWKLKEVPIENAKTRDCIRVFRAARWK